MNKFKSWVIITFLFFISSCGVPTTDAEISVSDETKLLLTILSELQARDYDAVRSHMDPQAKAQPGADKMLEYMSMLIPAGTPTSSHFEGWWVNLDTSSGRTSGVTANLEFSDRWLLVVATYSGDQKSLIATSYAAQTASKLPDGSSPFQATTSSPLQYFNLVIAVATTLGSLAAVILCLFTAGLKRKFLWVVASLFGISGLSFNSATGDFLINFLDFGGIDRSWYWPDASLGPVLHIVVPVGAIFFFIKRRQLLRSSDQPRASFND